MSHFKKDPANLSIRWEQYQSEYLDRFRNAKTRFDNGLAIAPDEQQQLRDNAAAISKSISDELSPVAQTKISPVTASDNQLKSDIKKQIIAQSIRDNEIVLHNASKTNYSINFQSIPNNEAKPDNLAAYQYHQPQPIENLADPKQVSEVVRGFLNKFKSTPKPDRSLHLDRSQLSKLNSWLGDPILYSEAVNKAKASGYHIEYSRDGVATKISEPEF